MATNFPPALDTLTNPTPADLYRIRHVAKSPYFFLPPFGGGFTNPFASSRAAAIPWYLSGGIAAANCVGAYQAKGAASLAASYVNLANPGTNDLTVGDAPAWDTSYGWDFTGSKYLQTGLQPTPSVWTMLVQFTNAPTGLSVIVGCIGLGDTRFFICPGNGSSNVFYGDGAELAVPPNLVSGNLALAGNRAYRNGTVEGDAIGAASGNPGRDIWIGCANSNGSPGFNSASKVRAVAIYNINIGATAVAAVATAMAAL